MISQFLLVGSLLGLQFFLPMASASDYEHPNYKPPASALELIQKLHPQADVDDIAGGDLDGDGLEDIAYVLKLSDDEGTQVIVGILRGGPERQFEPLIETKPFLMAQRPPEVAIRRRSLYVSTMWYSQSSGRWAYYQYSYRNGSLVLIGQEDFSRSPRLEIDPGPVAEESISTNFLTCQEVRTVFENKKKVKRTSKVNDCKLEKFEDFMNIDG